MIRLQLLVGKVQDTAPPYNSRQKEQLIEFRNSIFQTVNIFLPVDVIGTQRYVEMSVKQGIAVSTLPVKCISGQSDLQVINQAKSIMAFTHTFTPRQKTTTIKENHKKHHPRQLHPCRPRCSHHLPYFSVCLCPWEFFVNACQMLNAIFLALASQDNARNFFLEIIEQF